MPKLRQARRRKVVAVLAAAVVAFIVLQVYRGVSAKPGQTVDYGMLAMELVERYQPGEASAEGVNGWMVLLQAAEIVAEIEQFLALGAHLKEGEPTVEYNLVYDQAGSSVPDSQRAAVLERTSTAIKQARDRGVPELVEAAAGMPRMMRAGPQPGPLHGWLLPELGSFRKLARMNFARMRLATEAGDSGELLRAFESSLALARACRAQTMWIEGLVGLNIEWGAIQEFSRAMVERQWDEATLLAGWEALERQKAWTAPFDLSLEGERLACLDLMQWIHTDDGKGNGRLIITSYRSLLGGLGATTGTSSWLDALMKYRIVNIAGVGFASKKATVRRLNEFFDGSLEFLHTPRSQRNEMAFRPDRFILELSPRYTALRAIVPAVESGAASLDRNTLAIEALRIQVALERYRLQQGEYPEALQSLAPACMAEVPVDPFVGGAFGYRRLKEGEDAFGRGFLLYSFGVDGRDDGGAIDNVNPLSALSWSGQKHGVDFVFNMPRDWRGDAETPR